jgi:hypothetical protein
MNTTRKNNALLALLTMLCLQLMVLPASGGRGDSAEFRSDGKNHRQSTGSSERQYGARSQQNQFQTSEQAGKEKTRIKHDRSRNMALTEQGSDQRVRQTHRPDPQPRADRERRDAARQETGREAIERQARMVERIPDTPRVDAPTRTRPANAVDQAARPNHFRQSGDDRRSGQDGRVTNVQDNMRKGHGHDKPHRAVNRTWHDGRKSQPVFHREKSAGHRGPKHVVKHVVHHLPPKHTVIRHGRDSYHYYCGRYYRPHTSGYILVRPPLGLVVFSLPIGSRTVITAGVTYHVFGDVYYQRVSSGYQVVEPVRVISPRYPSSVTVVTDLLNVRYAPDSDEQIIAQVERYSVLEVIGNAPGWLYVDIPGEDIRGWIREEYVAVNVARG